MKNKQQIIQKIQRKIEDFDLNNYDIGNNEEQEIYKLLKDEVLKHKNSLSFLMFLEKKLEESVTTTHLHYCISNLINFIR